MRAPMINSPGANGGLHPDETGRSRRSRRSSRLPATAVSSAKEEVFDIAKSSTFDGQDDRRYRGADDYNPYTCEKNSHGHPVARQNLVANVERPK